MVGEDGEGRSKDRCERAGISAGGVHVLLEAGVEFVELEGRIQPLVVRMGEKRMIQCEE